MFLTKSWFPMFLFSILFLSFKLFAQDVPVPPTADELKAFLASLGGLKGAGSLAIVAVVVQGLMLFFRSNLAKFAGKFRLLIVLFLTLAGGVVALKVQGLDWGAVLLHSTTLAALQVFVNQLVKQLFTGKGNQ